MITDRAAARDVTADEIRDLITRHAPEENALEYKQTDDSDLIKAACAMANFGGGFILVGITEDASHGASGIVNVANVQRVADSIRQRLRDGLTPRPVFEVVPLSVDNSDIIVIRISPQFPPHMISSDKRTDFFSRYDATSEKMRYEEIEQAFCDKHQPDELALPQTPKAIIESTLGRTEVSQGAAGFIKDTVDKILARGEPMLALIAASDGNAGSIDEQAATRAFREPLYYRKGGWLVAHPELEVDSRLGTWEQSYGPYSQTTITPSGDLIFLKPVDHVLCWTQVEDDFKVAPRLYPNTIVEYCLSFSYVLADLAASSRPSKLLIVPMIVGAGAKLLLPLGEGGSIWFNMQVRDAHTLRDDPSVGVTMAETITTGRPMLSRNLAFRLASAIYSFFGYPANDVPFESGGEVTVEPDADATTLIAIRAYLRDTLLAQVSPPRQDMDRSSSVFTIDLSDGRRLLWVSKEFLYDYHFPETKLFGFLDQFKLTDKVRAEPPGAKLALTTSGVGPLP